MDAVSINNTHRDDLRAAMNAALPKKTFWDIIQDDTVLYKLSCRENYSILTRDNQSTVYGYFLEMKI